MRYWLVSGNKQCGVNCGRSWSNKISLIPLCRVSSKSAVYVSENKLICDQLKIPIEEGYKVQTNETMFASSWSKERQNQVQEGSELTGELVFTVTVRNNFLKDLCYI